MLATRLPSSGTHRLTRAFVPDCTPAPETPTHVSFQYTGSTELTLQSPLTSRIYHFAHPGAQVRADARDSAWLSSMPKLIAVQS